MKILLFIPALLPLSMLDGLNTSPPIEVASFYVLTLSSDTSVSFEATYISGGKPPTYRHITESTPFTDTLRSADSYVIVHRTSGDALLRAKLEPSIRGANIGSGSGQKDIIIICDTKIGTYVVAF